jgi:AraC family transcriptional regulator of adaptative response/methylated-DNA-[protein]-cysteine methyltransferase
MEITTLPKHADMVEAFLGRDRKYDGVFYTAVKTTGIFCRPTCPARKPRPDRVEFFASPRQALIAGYRPCKRCKPLQSDGHPPDWLDPLLQDIEKDPSRRWTDQALRSRGLQPERVRRWFQKHHGMTFHAYSRARRLGSALGQISHGEPIVGVAYDAGYESLSGFNDAVGKLVGETAGTASKSVRITMTRIPTPLGPMVAGATGEALVLLEFADRRMLPTQIDRVCRRLDGVVIPGSNTIIKQLVGELKLYFKGELTRFETPLLEKGTEFQEMVWSRLREIPYGQSVAYQDVAISIGRPTAVRAVARANGDNRIAIIIPCHRVVGKNGQLTGYGGGLWRKKRLLELEKVAVPD